MDTILNPTDPHPLETVPEDEEAQIQRVLDLQLEIMKARQDPAKRGQHPKMQALLRAELHVHADAPDDLRVGVFETPVIRPALVRLSTGLLPRDSDPQAHGLAIKLLDVEEAPGGTQDFILLDAPTFFVRNVAEYVELFEAQRTDPAGIADYLKRHRDQTGLVLSFNTVITSHLERPYWAEVPVAMGDGAARLSLTPAIENVSGQSPAITADGLRDALADHLVAKRLPARFTLGAQRYRDADVTPIEDATSVWPGAFEPLATLHIPPQDFRDPETRRFAEGLSFTPWHCHPAHRPLGGIQRARRRIYEASTALRRSLTGAATAEPTSADLTAAFRSATVTA